MTVVTRKTGGILRLYVITGRREGRKEGRLDFRGSGGIHSTRKRTGRGASSLVCGLLGLEERKIPTPIPRAHLSSNSCSNMSKLGLELLNHAYLSGFSGIDGLRLRTRVAPILPRLSNQFPIAPLSREDCKDLRNVRGTSGAESEPMEWLLCTGQQPVTVADQSSLVDLLGIAVLR